MVTSDRRDPVCRLIRVREDMGSRFPWVQYAIQYRQANLTAGMIWLPRSTVPELLEDLLTDLAVQQREESK